MHINLPTMYKIVSNILLSRLTPHAEEVTGNLQCGFRKTGQVLIMYSAFVTKLQKKWEYSEAVHQLFIDFKKAYDSVRWQVFYNILIAFGIPIKLVMLIKRVWLKPTEESVCVRICLMCFLLRMVENKEMLYRHCFSTLL